jgi:hypothetical protein
VFPEPGVTVVAAVGGSAPESPSTSPRHSDGATAGPLPRRWSAAELWGFRWLACYLGLYMLQPSPLDFLAPSLVAPWTAVWSRIVRLVAGWLGLDASVPPNASGDTTFNHVQVLCYAVIATLAATAWSALSRRREHTRLHHVLRAAVRVYLSLFMLLYGAQKIFKTQFADASLITLEMPFGELTPNGLLWAFMGHSILYSAVAGVVEMAGGLLLISRRTAVAGALVTAAAMAHVMVLDVAYDVVVKLFALHLLAMAVWLAAPGLARLFALLVLQRPVEPVPIVALTVSRRRHRALVTVRTTVLVLFAALLVLRAWSTNRRLAGEERRTPLRGVWVAERSAGAPLLRLVLEGGNEAAAQLGDGGWRHYAWWPAGRALGLTPAATASPAPAELEVRRLDAGRVVAEGRLEGRPVRVVLRRVDPRHRLETTPFRWVRERPEM